MLKILVALFILPSAVCVASEHDSLRIDSNLPYVMNGAKYVIFTHAAPQWDRGATRDRTKDLLLTLKTKWDRPEILAIASSFASFQDSAFEYYLNENDVDGVIESSSGGHRIAFQNASTLMFAGGNLALCLCETIRDAIGGSGDGPLNIELLTEIIFDFPEFYEPYQVKSEEVFGAKESLSKLLRTVSDHQLRKFVIKELLGGRKKFCPRQPGGNLSPMSYRFSLKRDGKEIGKINSFGRKLVTIDFKTSLDSPSRHHHRATLLKMPSKSRSVVDAKP